MSLSDITLVRYLLNCKANADLKIMRADAWRWQLRSVALFYLYSED
jgi:hypothetical protein